MIKSVTFLFLFISSAIFPCTDFLIETKDGSYINGRSLEFEQDLQSQFKVYPRGQKRVSMAPGRKKGMEWTSKYGFVGITCFGLDLAYDGLNEAGLSFGYLWMPGATQYPQPTDPNMALDYVDFGAWLLGNFATVAEVKRALMNGVVVWAHPIPQIGLAPIHVAIHDAMGNNLVIEFVDQKMKIYDNPVSVLTNSPPFDWQMDNLQNYTHLTATNADPVMFRGKTFTAPGQGSGMLGIPGDCSPPSRFVKIATYLRFATPVRSGREGVCLAEHLLNSVDIPLGEVRDKGKDTGDYTQWAVVKDLKQKIYYFRSYNDLCLKMIDLKKLDFEKTSSKTLPVMDKGASYVDVTEVFSGRSRMTVSNQD